METARHDTISTYRHLRLAMALVLALLLVSVAVQVLSTDPTCLQTSISAYYFTSVRAVFVGCLCALGACLVVYRGNTDWEDRLLNLAGSLAFIVAFVPTGVDRSCDASNVPSRSELNMLIDNSVTSLIAVGVLALGAAAGIVWRTGVGRGGRGDDRDGQRRAALSVLAGALPPVVATTVFVVARPTFRAHAHTSAAVVMFVAVITVVALNALGVARQRAASDPATRARNHAEAPSDDSGEVPAARDFSNAYTAVADAMAGPGLAFAVSFLVAPDFRQRVFWLEAMILLEFAAFWVVQTVELWGLRTRLLRRPANLAAS